MIPRLIILEKCNCSTVQDTGNCNCLESRMEAALKQSISTMFGFETRQNLKKIVQMLETRVYISCFLNNAKSNFCSGHATQSLLKKLELLQPENGLARSNEEAEVVAARIGYPLVIRPSYVLGGRAMEIVHDLKALRRYMSEAVQVSGDSPVLLDSYLQDAIEVDLDAISDGDDVYVAGVLQHIEEAGIHSGDSACSLPPFSLSEPIIAEMRRQAILLAKTLKVIGLMNIQFAVKDETAYIIEVNPRASRTVPFVAKATGIPVAKIATRVMVGEKLKSFDLGGHAKHKHVAVKEAVFPFARFPGVDIILGPEMKSTGEVMGLDVDFPRAFAKAQLASSQYGRFPSVSLVTSSGFPRSIWVPFSRCSRT